MIPWIKTLKEFLIEYEALEHYCNGLHDSNSPRIEGVPVRSLIDRGITWHKTEANYGNPKGCTWGDLHTIWLRLSGRQYPGAIVPEGINHKELADALRAPDTPTAKLLKHVRDL